MKRLALLLAAMGIISVGAMAETPKLEVTHFNQEIEIENEASGPDLDSIFFGNTVGLKYGDYTFGVTGGKFWSYDGHGGGLDSTNARLQIDVWKKVADNFKIGYRLRAQDEYDRHYIRWDYSNNWFWSSGDVWYEATNQDGNTGKNDWIKTEVFPIGVKFGNLKVGYFLNYNFTVGNTDEVNGAKNDEYIEHQIRAYFPLYKGEKLTLNFEGRFTLSADYGFEGKEPAYRHYDEFGRNRLYIKPSYKVSDALTVYGYYGYEFREWKTENGYTDDHSKENYTDFGIGWTYNF